MGTKVKKEYTILYSLPLSLQTKTKEKESHRRQKQKKEKCIILFSFSLPSLFPNIHYSYYYYLPFHFLSIMGLFEYN